MNCLDHVSGDLTKWSAAESVTVEMVVDADGKPFSLSAITGLPDNVVHALSLWRFQPAKRGGGNVAVSLKLTVQVRKPITDLKPAKLPSPPASAPDGDIETVRPLPGNVEPAKLIKKVHPAYPDDAKSRGIQGTVAFNSIVDKEGKVRNLELVSGPLALYKAAGDAVLKWKYQATRINGQPVEVFTRLYVNFTLSR